MDPVGGMDAVRDVLLGGGQLVGFPSGDVPGARVLEGRGWIVVPGLVDLHGHLREPGFEHKGTIATETLAAARGGFTTICAMPNTEPAPDTAPVVEALKESIAGTAVVEVLPIGCVSRRRAGGELAELIELAAAGCVAFSDDGSPVADALLMRRALTIARELGLRVSEHCDDPVLNAGGVMNEGRVSERLGLAGQPAAGEVSAIARNIALAETTGGKLHVAHVTTARGVELVADAKRRGVDVTCEVTPSHLFLTEEAVFGPGPEPAYNTNAKINPPLRTEADRRALLAGVNDGTIDAIATDHAPHAREDKLCEFDDAAFGIGCYETALATVTTLVDRGELDLERALAALTIGPVGAFGLERWSPVAGMLKGGTSAAVIDPAAQWTVDVAAFASKGKNSPLDGMSLTGRVLLTVRDGLVVHEALGVEV